MHQPDDFTSCVRATPCNENLFEFEKPWGEFEMIGMILRELASSSESQ